MLIGAMNHPQRDIDAEMRWMAEMGLDFIDLTLEPPAAASWRVDAQALRAALQRYKLAVVGHTAYYLPLASPIEEVRRGAVVELRRCLDIFGSIGVRWMNIHPDRHAPMHDRAFYIGRNIESLRELIPYGKERGVGLMIENLPGDFNSAAQLGELLDPLPELGVHLDIGHSNLLVTANSAAEILGAYGHRLRHVHLHDNKGGHADLHLPLGTGTVDVAATAHALQTSGYDGTVTLEVFTPDPHYLAYSRDRWRQIWNARREPEFK